jgi:hypothetical protein
MITIRSITFLIFNKLGTILVPNLEFIYKEEET